MPSWNRVRAVLLGLASMTDLATMSENQVAELLAAWDAFQAEQQQQRASAR